MERQPQNPEFRNNPENFHTCMYFYPLYTHRSEIRTQVLWKTVKTQMKCSIKLQHCFRRLKQPSGSEIHHNIENSTQLKLMAMAETTCTVIYTPYPKRKINNDWKLNTSQHHRFVCSF